MMADIKLNVTNEYNNIDFTSWTEEKLRNILLFLSEIDTSSMSQADHLSMSYAMSDALKLYAAITGENELYDNVICGFLLKHGRVGLTCVLYAFGLSYEKGEIVEMFECNQAVDEIWELIGSDDFNKGRLTEKLAQFKRKTKMVIELDDDLEKVNMHQETWDWFYHKHKNDDKTKAYHLLDLPAILEEKLRNRKV